MTAVASQSAPTGLRGIRRKLVASLEITLVAVLLAFTLKSFVIEAILVPSRSMESTILAGDYLFVNKLVYGSKSPALPFLGAGAFHLPGFRRVARGDVIVFDLPRSPAAPPVRFVKRCVAVAGDDIALRGGILSVNGVLLPGQHPSSGEFGPERVPSRGDRLSLSAATLGEWREFIEREGHTVGTSPGGDVLVDGLPGATYTVEGNYLFALGDNREHSDDSRHWGFLPEENVIGQAMLVYWSHDETGGIRWDRLGTVIR
jgi:signal peptidase I